MPLPSDSFSEDERREFCRRLKVLRERKGITLAAIAERTKIRASLFAALEQNDLRAWPKGIYRRAYFREYARLLDEPLDEICEEFNCLFTDEAEPPAAATPTELPPVRSKRDPAADLRLVFDTGWQGPKTPVLARLLAAISDVVIIGVVSGVMMLASGLDAVVIMAAVTLAYFSLGTVLFGESPANWMIQRREQIMAVFASQAEAPEDEPRDEPHEERPWISDATRVGPSPPPQLRVRFKV